MHMPHIPDDELLLALDGELEPSAATRVRAHLDSCWHCRSRQQRLTGAISDFMATQPDEAALAIPPAAGPTALLRARIRHAHPPHNAFTWLRPGLWAGLASASLAIIFWLAGTHADAAGPLPNATLTPGAVRYVSSEQVCQVDPSDEGPLVPRDLARVVFEHYSITNPAPRSYEVDYLISPALGGTTAVENLWPVPYSQGIWTSRVKDALESHLRSLVCSGKIDLPTAQREIATNWIASYQRRFGVSRPLPAHQSYVKDSPWE